MPFDSFLSKTKTKRGMLFHATVGFSVVVHAGALAWATVFSLADVQQVRAPSVKLSFLAPPTPASPAASPEPKPVDSAGGSSATPALPGHRPRRSSRQRSAAPAPANPAARAPAEAPLILSAPTEVAPLAGDTGSPAPASEGGGSAVAGIGGGMGTGNGSGSGPALAGGGGAPRILPEALGKLQRVSGATPTFPAQLAQPGARFLVMAKVCVGAEGTVNSVTLLKRADPLLDQSVMEAAKQWRYRPLMAGDTPVPFCTFVRFEFHAEN